MKAVSALPSVRTATGRSFGRRLAARLRRFAAARDGAGAVEFAIIVPLLLVGYIGAYEISVAMSVSNKIGRASATISDLLTQKESVGTTDFSNMKMAAESILSPYKTAGGIDYVVVGVQIEPGSAKVAWARDDNDVWPSGGKYAKGADWPLPDEMKEVKAFVVLTQVSMAYKIEFVERLLPFLRGSTTSSIVDPTISRSTFNRQRKGNTITCSDCLSPS